MDNVVFNHPARPKGQRPASPRLNDTKLNLLSALFSSSHPFYSRGPFPEDSLSSSVFLFPVSCLCLPLFFPLFPLIGVTGSRLFIPSRPLSRPLNLPWLRDDVLRLKLVIVESQSRLRHSLASAFVSFPQSSDNVRPQFVGRGTSEYCSAGNLQLLSFPLPFFCLYDASFCSY